MRLLITGATGFAGRHLAARAAALGHEVHALVRPGREGAAPAGAIPHPADLGDAAALAGLLRRLAPDAVAHLAGASSVGGSFAEPAATWDINLGGALAVLEALRAAAPDTPALFVSSGEVYGRLDAGELPAGPDSPMRPLSPYGASKGAADLAAGAYRAAYGVRAMRVRAFNHVGPGQDARFVLPAVARQIAEAERRGEPAARVRVGNLDTRRDFTDVRDIVRAYLLVLERGDPDAVYLACSGRSRPVRDLVEGVAALARIPVELVPEGSLQRAGEQPDLYGSPARLRADTGWTPEIAIETTLSDTLDWWRERAVGA